MNLESASYPRLIADIGGTNARFALQHEPAGDITDVGIQPAAGHASLQDAIRAYLAAQGDVSPRWCVIGIATPVTGDRVSMTNHPWSFSIAAMKAELGLDRLLVINDFAALALAVPVLPADALRRVGGGQARAGGTLALIGPGTGLGVGGLARLGRNEVPVVGEGGHVTLAAVDDHEAAVLERLRAQFGHASGERALSGQGLVNLFDACSELAGRAPRHISAADITDEALASGDAQCVDAVGLFFAFLGTTAGNLALTLGAQGGVYIGGGIVPRLGTLLDASRFRARFEAKGRFTGYLQAIPTLVIDSAFPPALTGAARAFEVYDRG